MIQQEAWKLWLAVGMIAVGCIVWVYCEWRIHTTSLSYKVLQWTWWQRRAGWTVILGVAMLLWLTVWTDSATAIPVRIYRGD